MHKSVPNQSLTRLLFWNLLRVCSRAVVSLNCLKIGLEKPLILNINLDSHQYFTRSSDVPLMIQSTACPCKIKHDCRCHLALYDGDPCLELMEGQVCDSSDENTCQVMWQVCWQPAIPTHWPRDSQRKSFSFFKTALNSLIWSVQGQY